MGGGLTKKDDDKLKIELEEIESCVKKISVEVPLERINKEKEAIFAQLAKDVSIPGFRKGRVPHKILEKRYSKSVLDDAAQRLIQTSYQEAIETNMLQPVGDPMVDDIRIEENEPLSFTATVEVQPKIELADFTGHKMERKISIVTDAQIDKILGAQRERNARFEPVEDRAVQEGDFPLIDYSATKDGQPLKMFQGKNKQVHISRDDMLGEVYTQIIGMGKGEEKTFEDTLPKEFPDPELAEARLVFTIRVNEIKRKVLPELDDDFAREISSFDTMDDYKADLKTNLEKRNDSTADNNLRDDVMDYLIELNQFDPPPRMVERRAETIADRTEKRFSQQGIDFASSGLDHEKFRDKYKENAVKEIKEQFILAAIAEKERIKVEEDDMEKEIANIAELMGQSPESTREQIARSNGSQGLYQKVFMDKVYNAILAKMIIEDKYVEEKDDKQT